MVLKEHSFTQITTYEYPMWRKSYVSGTMVVKVDETEFDPQTNRGNGTIVEILSGKGLRLNDDYTDLHGGLDCLNSPTTLEDLKKMVEGKEGSFEHYEKSIPPTHEFKLKKQFPIEIKPQGSPFEC
jgi:hypothetical protein